MLMKLDGRRKANALPRRIQKVPGHQGLYVDSKTGTYLRRVQSGGRNTYESLGTAKKPQALKTMQDVQLGEVAVQHGLTIPAARKPVTVRVVIERYRDDGFPDQRGVKRAAGPHLRAEQDAVATLLEYFQTHHAHQITQNDLDAYHDWRLRAVRKGTGHRSTDLELNTLNNAMKWAVRKQLLKSNPVAERVRYYSPTQARHCKDVAPISADDLHTTARLLFADRRSESLGWQALFEALTGLRTGEALALRMDAAPNEPGWLTEDGGSLCVRRSKKAGRENPFVEVHDGLKVLLVAHRAWHQGRHASSPWFFPGRDSQSKLTTCALTHGLTRLYREQAIARKLTSHGLRAFYVLVRRSNGILDTQIAWEVNHIGGVGTLEKSYGGVPQHWRDGKSPRLSWLPQGPLAWASLLAPPPPAAKALNP